MGLVHLPVVGRRAVGILLGLDQGTVGNDDERLVDGDDHLGGGAVVGIVVAGKPVVGVFGLALCPDRQRLLGIGRVRGHEVEARFGRAAVSDRQVDRVVGSVRLVEGDRQLLSLGRELAGRRLRADRDLERP